MHGKKHRGWIASLSNGQTVLESNHHDNDTDPWQSLIAWCKENGICITQMRLQYNGITSIAMGDADGYVQLKRYRIRDPGGHSTLCHGIGSVIKDTVFITWMNANGDSWQDICSLDSVRIHCLINTEITGD